MLVRDVILLLCKASRLDSRSCGIHGYRVGLAGLTLSLSLEHRHSHRHREANPNSSTANCLIKTLASTQLGASDPTGTSPSSDLLSQHSRASASSTAPAARCPDSHSHRHSSPGSSSPGFGLPPPGPGLPHAPVRSPASHWAGVNSSPALPSNCHFSGTCLPHTPDTCHEACPSKPPCLSPAGSVPCALLLPTPGPCSLAPPSGRAPRPLLACASLLWSLALPAWCAVPSG